MSIISKSLFKNTRESKFRELTIPILLASDILNILYIDAVILNTENLNRMVQESIKVQSAVLSTQQMGHLSPEMIDMVISSTVTSAWVMIVLFFIFNLIFYIFYKKRKKSGVKFLKGYTLSGAIITMIFCLFSGANFSFGWKVALLSSAVAYLYIYLGVKHFQEKTLSIHQNEEL
ncbi:MAG: hypothetical protein ACI9QD_000868 [Thermoproteota archaeon]|jgi:hypothetical protein